MPIIKKFIFRCALCHRRAGRVLLKRRRIAKEKKKNIPKEEQKNCSIIIEGPFQKTTREIKEEEFSWLKSLLTKKDFKTFYRKYQDNISFYCPECQQFYCKKHWSNYQMVIDEGFFDYATAECPEGHEVTVDD